MSNIKNNTAMKRITMISILLIVMVLMTATIWNTPLISSKGYIKGSVEDLSDSKGLDCSSIALISKDDPGVTYGTLADSKGNFYIRSIPFGKYYLSAYMIGYKKKIVREIEFSRNFKRIDIGKIMLQKDYNKIYDLEISASSLKKNSPNINAKNNKAVLSDSKKVNFKNNL